MKYTLFLFSLLILVNLDLFGQYDFSKEDRKVYKTALKKYNKGLYSEAFILTDRIVKSNPENIDVNYLLAEIQEATEDLFEAKFSYEITRDLIYNKINDPRSRLSSKERKDLNNRLQYCANRIGVLAKKTGTDARKPSAETPHLPAPVEQPDPLPSILSSSDVKFLTPEIILKGSDAEKIATIQEIVLNERSLRSARSRWRFESADRFSSLNDAWDILTNSRTINYINLFNKAQNELLQSNIAQQESKLKLNTLLGNIESLTAEKENLEQTLKNHEETINNYSRLIKSYAVGLDNKKRAVPKSIILICKSDIESESALTVEDYDRMQNYAEQLAIKKLNGYKWTNLAIEKTINSDTDLKHYFSQETGGIAQAKVFSEVTRRDLAEDKKIRYVAYHINVKESSPAEGLPRSENYQGIDVFEYKKVNGSEVLECLTENKSIDPSSVFMHHEPNLGEIRKKYNHSVNINAKYEESIRDFCDEFLDQKKNLENKSSAYSLSRQELEAELMTVKNKIAMLRSEVEQLDMTIQGNQRMTIQKWNVFDSMYHFLDLTYALERYTALPNEAQNKSDEVHLKEIVQKSYYECLNSNTRKKKTQTFLLQDNTLTTTAQQDVFEPRISKFQIISLGLTDNPTSVKTGEPVITLNLGFEITWEKEGAFSPMIPVTNLSNSGEYLQSSVTEFISAPVIEKLNPIYPEDIPIIHDRDTMYILNQLSSAKEFNNTYARDGYRLVDLYELNDFFGSLASRDNDQENDFFRGLKEDLLNFVSRDYTTDVLGDRHYQGIIYNRRFASFEVTDRMAPSQSVYIIYKEK